MSEVFILAQILCGYYCRIVLGVRAVNSLGDWVTKGDLIVDKPSDYSYRVDPVKVVDEKWIFYWGDFNFFLDR